MVFKAHFIFLIPRTLVWFSDPSHLEAVRVQRLFLLTCYYLLISGGGVRDKIMSSVTSNCHTTMSGRCPESAVYASLYTCLYTCTFIFFSPQHVSFFLLAMTQTCTHWRWFSKAKVNTNIRFYSRPTMTQCYHLIELYLHDTCSITSCQLKRSFICIIKYSVDWGTVSLIGLPEHIL